MSACIGCGCDDEHACKGGCSWLRVDEAEEVGVCSQCPQLVATWNAGDRDFSDEAMDAIAERAELEHAAKGPNEECPICGGIECKSGCVAGSEIL